MSDTELQTISRYPFPNVHANPFQTREALDPAVVQSRANDFKARGMLQTPLARPKPGTLMIGDAPVEIELAFGHTRFAAWQIAFPNELFPVILRELTDREMSEHAISENGQRSDITSIEKARALKRHIETFKTTQKEAGALMDLNDASSVSHLLSLLNLPERVQELAHTGALPERFARMLEPVARYFPDAAAQAAQYIADAKPDEKESAARNAIGNVWNQNAQDLHNLPWNEKWTPDAKMSADMHRADKGEPDAPPACAGCKFRHQFSNQQYCARPTCYGLKFRVHAVTEAARQSKQLGIALASSEANEKITMLMGNSREFGFDAREKYMRAVRHAKKLPSLRLVPLMEKSPTNSYSYYLKDVTGSLVVGLGTVNKSEIDQFCAVKEGKAAKPVKPLVESPREKEIRLEREAEQAAERKAERAAALETKYDVLWLLEHTADECAKQMQISGGILIHAETLVHTKATFNPNIEELKAIHHRLSAEVYSEMWTPTGRAPKKEVVIDAAVEQLRRAHIIFDMLCEHVIGYRNISETFKWADAQKETERIVTAVLRLSLPKEWNVPPAHRTAVNCWHCGKFSSNERGLSKADKEVGWGVVEQAGKIVYVHCPVHRGFDYQKAVTGFDEWKADKAKGKGKKK